MKNKSLEIVIIEDEEDILELLEYHLQKAGYETMGFLSTDKVEQFLEEEEPVLMIVDRNLPTVEGSEFVAQMRSLGYTVPVIFLTAKDKETDLEEGFERGADDYMTKPFSPKELLLRIKAILTRSGALENNRLKHRDIVMDIKKHELSIAGKVIELSNLEFDLLHTFMKNSNQALERDFLREEVWREEGMDFHEKTINVTISRLKKKIDPMGDKEYLLPIRNVGYKLV
ncbi:MAG: Two-component system response regulator [uncultured Sulfurovum sp.]|uniref:Two-component system response regulator n=1 Tax=uncultured Sulfurovum sp. TaxID=269237 RepID=A0A6S6TP65_9BACT|nr:MAG: Two-component system response regulator [uncultured Sulfurovum sp.]